MTTRGLPQVATDVRLWMREEVWVAHGELLGLIDIMAGHAEAHAELLMAGVTHLQPAQPVRYAHWLLSHAVSPPLPHGPTRASPGPLRYPGPCLNSLSLRAA